MMHNTFFSMALKKASVMLGSKGRLVVMAIQLVTKARKVNWPQNALKEQLFLTGRLVKAFAMGRYKAIPIRSILLVTASIIYFINPLDLVPDAVIGFGLTDDLTILTGVLNLIGNELEKFSRWEDGNAAGFI